MQHIESIKGTCLQLKSHRDQRDTLRRLSSSMIESKFRTYRYGIFIFVKIKHCMNAARRVYTFTHRLPRESQEAFCMYACRHRYLAFSWPSLLVLLFDAGRRRRFVFFTPPKLHCPYYLENTISQKQLPVLPGDHRYTLRPQILPRPNHAS